MLCLVLAVGLGVCPAGRSCESLEGHLVRGERFSRSFGPGLTLLLEPTDTGWEVAVRDDRPSENIARLTPPLHSVPNPRYLEGWHFRNADNTGPNDGSVNAPQLEREFFFSPEVGRSLHDPRVPEQWKRLEASGRGRLVIKSLTLGALERGQTAHITQLQFAVSLSWPASWLRGGWR